VLFIPGNAGTYKQVRSFGSEMSKIVSGDYSKLVDEKTVSACPNVSFLIR
jgi:hypothetical protein